MKRIGEARERELERIGGRAKVYAYAHRTGPQLRASGTRLTLEFVGTCSGLMLLSTGIPAVVTLSTFGAFVFLQKETLEASTAFTALSLFGLLREAVSASKFFAFSFCAVVRLSLRYKSLIDPFTPLSLRDLPSFGVHARPSLPRPHLDLPNQN